MKKPVLIMIVKNESRVIKRCLDSCAPWVDGCFIHDTGSTDDTIEKIKRHAVYLGAARSEVVSVPWVGMGHNRARVFEDASQHIGNDGYVLMHDADDVMSDVPEGWQWPELTEPGYMLELQGRSHVWWRTQVFSAEHNWRYSDGWHAVAVLDGYNSRTKLPWPKITPTRDGGASTDGNQTARYIRIAGDLHAKWIEENHLRSLYYAAQSYKDAGEVEMAIKMYTKRGDAGGWPEEAWHATYMAAMLTQRLHGYNDGVEKLLLKAIDARPNRMEPYILFAENNRKKGKHVLARVFAMAAACSPAPPKDDVLFVERQCYGMDGWRVIDELSLAEFHIGDYQKSIALMEQLQQMETLPDREKKRVEDNIKANRKAM